MARFLVVGEGERASALAGLVQRKGHVVTVVGSPERSSLEHVAIVCWLSKTSPERFLLGAVDSSMRGFAYEPGDWEPIVAETAAHNSIPVAVLGGGSHDASTWAGEALVAIDELLTGAQR